MVGLSRASVHSYLPYTKGSYNMTELSTNAERTQLYRERKAALGRLQDMVSKSGYVGAVPPVDVDSSRMEVLACALWDTLLLFQGYPFKTAKGLKFTYCIRGNEMFVDRKEKTVTRATIDMALKCVAQSGGVVTGPKKLGTFGSSYLYPIFKRFGILY